MDVKHCLRIRKVREVYSESCVDTVSAPKTNDAVEPTNQRTDFLGVNQSESYLKSGMPQETETPAPVKTMMLLLLLIRITNQRAAIICVDQSEITINLYQPIRREHYLIRSTQSSRVLMCSSFSLRGGSDSRLNKIFHMVIGSRLSGISLPELSTNQIWALPCVNQSRWSITHLLVTSWQVFLWDPRLVSWLRRASAACQSCQASTPDQSEISITNHQPIRSKYLPDQRHQRDQTENHHHLCLHHLAPQCHH